MDIVWLIFLIGVGACVGSFMNVVIWRLPRGESIVFPGSHCPKCGRAIKWYDNIPLLSWFVLRGRCRRCKASISPRYLLIEAAGAALFGGLYAWLYVLMMRDGAGTFFESWITFGAHALLLCGLLVCSVVDVAEWTVPLEVCWVVSAAGLAAAAVRPPAAAFLTPVSATVGAMGIAAVVGLAAALLAQHYGLIQQSFLDAAEPAPAGGRPPGDDKRITAVAITRAHGVNPRTEILREAVFLAPAVVLAGAAYLLVTHVGWARNTWGDLNSEIASGAFAHHFAGFQAALFGYLVGGLCVWAVRILGTLAFGKEAMGLGDVHILAAVGAVTGWVVPVLAFFVAPFFGLLWALHLWIGRNQRELPYGPWLGAATLVVLLFYDGIVGLLWSNMSGLELLFR